MALGRLEKSLVESHFTRLETEKSVEPYDFVYSGTLLVSVQRVFFFSPCGLRQRIPRARTQGQQQQQAPHVIIQSNMAFVGHLRQLAVKYNCTDNCCQLLRSKKT